MKSLRFSIFFMLFLVSTFYLPSTFTQDYTQGHLPEGAKVRLGKGIIQELAYSPDRMRLAVVSSIGIWLYDAQTGEELPLLPGDVSDVAFSPDGQTLESENTGFDATIRLWDTKTCTPLRTLAGHTGASVALYSVRMGGCLRVEVGMARYFCGTFRWHHHNLKKRRRMSTAMEL